jgi:hypothetical protein
MNLTDMRARMERLAKLAQGLAEEASIWKKCEAPVLYVHRLEYVEGIQYAVSGLEKASVALSKMIRGWRKTLKPRGRFEAMEMPIATSARCSLRI